VWLPFKLEQAGSGIPKIFQGWGSRHWRSPVLYEKGWLMIKGVDNPLIDNLNLVSGEVENRLMSLVQKARV